MSDDARLAEADQRRLFAREKINIQFRSVVLIFGFVLVGLAILGYTIAFPAALPPGLFPHFSAIVDSHSTIWRAYRQRKIVMPITPLCFDALTMAAPADPILKIQHIARGIAVYLGVPVTIIVVTFKSHLGHPGHVELGQGYEFWIELDDRYRDMPRTIASILSHEVMHIYLHKKDVYFSDTATNEILTDTACYIFGLGGLMLGGWYENTSYQGKVTQKTHFSFGYLTVHEATYLMARRIFLLNEKYDSQFRSDIVVDAYRAERLRVKREFWRSPLWLNNHARMWSMLLAKVLRKCGSQIMIERCPTCLQLLRLPRSKGLLGVRCPTCGNRCSAYT